MAASVALRYALGADGVGAARPGARGSRVTASRYALGAEGGGAARDCSYSYRRGVLNNTGASSRRFCLLTQPSKT